jgi:hypothetical protein
MMEIFADINNKFSMAELTAASIVFSYYAWTAADWFYNSFTFFI